MYSILFVDDEPALLGISKIFLEQEGEFVVDTATSAPAALSLLTAKTYDAIVSDYQMPGMDGIEFLKEVRGSGNTVPFILFTGRGREEIVIQALNEGADFYLQKGGEPRSQFAELTHKIRRAIARRATEIALSDSEKRLSAIINFLPDATFAIDMRGKVISWNKAIEEMTGIPVAMMLGKGDYEYALPFYGVRRPLLIDLISAPEEKVAEYYSSITREGDTLSAETDLPHPKGQQIWVLTKASPLYNRHGDRVGAIEAIRDITERKRGEDALHVSEEKIRESEEFLQRVITGAHEGIIVYDRDLRITLWNRFMEEMTGMQAAEVRGQKAVEVFPFVREKGVEALMRQALEGSPVESPDFEFFIQSTGKKGWVKGIYSPNYNSHGAIIGVIGVVRDVTKRKELETSLKESEERYRNIVEDQTEFICRFLPDGTHVFVNEAYCRYFGMQREAILGHRFRPEIHAEDRKRVKQFFAALTPDRPVNTIEHRIIMTDGMIRWQRWSDRAIFNPAGMVTEYQSVGRDITEAKAAEAALRESEERLRTILAAAQVGIILVDAASHTILQANPQALAMIKASEGEVTGAICHNFICPAEEGACPVTDLGEAVNTSERVLITKDGVHLPIIKTVVSTRIGNKNVLVESFIDITDIKRSEKALRESEDRWRTLAGAALEGIMILDGRMIVDCNPQFAAMFGYRPDEIIGKIGYDFMLTAESRDAISRWRREGAKGTLDVTGIRKDGTQFTAESATTTITWQGKPQSIVQLHDITDRKMAEQALRESEERYRTLIEHANEAIVVVQDGRICFANPKLEAITDYAQDEFTQMPFLDFVHPDDRAMVGEQYRRRLSGEPLAAPYVFRIISREGSVHWMEISASLITWNGRPADLVLLSDITERRKAEEALREANRKLNLLFGITRHDINNQLMVIQGYTKLATLSKPDPAVTDFLTKITVAVTTIQRQVDFTRTYEDLGMEAPRWFRVCEVAHGVRPGGISVVCSCDSCTVFADPMIGRVFFNLFDNAMKHGQQVTTVTISCEHAGDELVITVADNGTGIPLDEKQKIFDKGYGKNTGYGLFLAREILAITGITIHETGTHGKGARFEMTVPKGAYRLS